MRFSPEMIFLIIVLLNTIIGIAYPSYGLSTNNKEEINKLKYVSRSLVIILCPVIGIVYFVISHLLYRVFFHKPVDVSDVIFSKQRMKSLIKADSDREMNVVPIEEAIAVSDTGSLRSLMLNVIRGDIQKSLSSVALALNSYDSETSHYAASVLKDELNDFRANTQKIYIEIRKHNENEAEYCVMMIQYMNSILCQKVFSDIEQISYVNMMENVCEILYENDKSKMTANFYEWISLRLLEVKDFEKCKKWCMRSAEEYPCELSSYTCRLKLYFTMDKKEEFFEVMAALKKSDIIIDSETLELIRTFS